MPPSNRITMATKVQPLLSLNPYQNIWKIKALLTGKGTMRTYNNARGEGCVFNVELTDEAGTQMQATMFNDVARKFFDKFALGKVYYISKGTIKVANKQFRTVENDYEMTLTQYSQVEEAINETMLVPERRFNFVPIDKLGAYVNEKGLVDVIGVVEHVAPIINYHDHFGQKKLIVAGQTSSSDKDLPTMTKSFEFKEYTCILARIASDLSTLCENRPSDLVVKQYLKMGINGLVMIYRARCLEEKACWSWKIHPPRSRKHADSRDVEVGTTAKKVRRKTNMMSVSERLLKEFCYLICHKVMNLPLTTISTMGVADKTLKLSTCGVTHQECNVTCNCNSSACHITHNGSSLMIGKGASAVGLRAALHKDRVSIHEAMEQQSISISKAGIVTSL